MLATIEERRVTCRESYAEECACVGVLNSGPPWGLEVRLSTYWDLAAGLRLQSDRQTVMLQMGLSPTSVQTAPALTRLLPHTFARLWGQFGGRSTWQMAQICTTSRFAHDNLSAQPPLSLPRRSQRHQLVKGASMITLWVRFCCVKYCCL